MNDETKRRDAFADFCTVGKASLTDEQRDALSYLYLAAKNTRDQASAPEGEVVAQGKDGVAAMASFIQTGTVVPNGDIGLVTMWVGKEHLGKTVYLYDHAYQIEKMTCLGCDSLRCKDCFEAHANEQGYTRSNAKAVELVPPT